ncbi:hypothetical protein FF1_025689 [Malus domestica]
MPLGPPPSMTPDSLKGYVYDTQSMSWGTFRSPKSSKPIGTMIAAYGKLYYLASPACLVYEMPSPPLERYDPGADQFNFNSTTYSVSRPLTLPGLKGHTESVHCDPTSSRTEYIVHLGGSDFCLVQTAMESCRSDCQPLWVTTFRIVIASGGGSYIETLHSTPCDVDISGASFRIRYSFAKDEECDGLEPVEEENGSASDADAEDYGFSPDKDEWNSEETTGDDDEDDKDYMK